MSTPIPADLVAKRAAWRLQHDALRAQHYRLTLVGRGPVDGRRFNLGKPRDPAEPERFYTADQVEAELVHLRGRNSRGFDIYVTPIDPAAHYIVIDDMKPGALALLRANGYSPCLVQASSLANEQAVLKVPKRPGPDEQSLANALVRRLNMAWGDPAFSGVIHPFRLAGFSNRKAGRDLAFTRLLYAEHSLCARAGAELEQLRCEAAPSPSSPAPARGPARPEGQALEVNADSGSVGALAAAIDRARARALQRRLPDDASSHDFRACCVLLRAGRSELELVDALEVLAHRHSSPRDYAERTVRAAWSLVARGST